MTGLSVKFLMADKVKKAFGIGTSGTAVDKPLEGNIKKATLYYEGEVKKRTPVQTGRMRSSITHEINQDNSKVGTNVIYSPFVEYGTEKMEARHVSPGSSSRVTGEGPFSAAMTVFLGWLRGKGMDDLADDIEKRFRK